MSTFLPARVQFAVDAKRINIVIVVVLKIVFQQLTDLSVENHGIPSSFM